MEREAGSSDLPDLQIPEPGHTLTAISVRTTEHADLVEILVRLRAAGAEVVTVNSFPATRGDPDETRVFDMELRDIPGEVGAQVAGGVPGPSLWVAPATITWSAACGPIHCGQRAARALGGRW